MYNNSIKEQNSFLSVSKSKTKSAYILKGIVAVIYSLCSKFFYSAVAADTSNILSKLKSNYSFYEFQGNLYAY